MQMQVLKVKLLQYQQRQQGYRTAAAGPQSNWLQVICLILRVLQVQAAVSVWQHVATAADGEESSTRDAIVPTNAMWAAACCLLCYWLFSAMVPAVMMPFAVLVVALWLGWGVAVTDSGRLPQAPRDSSGLDLSPGDRQRDLYNPQSPADLPVDDTSGQGHRQGPPEGTSILTTYSRISELPPDIMCGASPCLLASTMEHTAWPVTWQQPPAAEPGSEASGSHQQQQLLQLLLLLLLILVVHLLRCLLAVQVLACVSDSFYHQSHLAALLQEIELEAA